MSKPPALQSLYEVARAERVAKEAAEVAALIEVSRRTPSLSKLYAVSIAEADAAERAQVGRAA